MLRTFLTVLFLGFVLTPRVFAAESVSPGTRIEGWYFWGLPNAPFQLLLKIRRDAEGRLSATLANISRGEMDPPVDAILFDPPQVRIEFSQGILVGRVTPDGSRMQLEYRGGDFVFPFEMERVEPERYPPLQDLDFKVAEPTKGLASLVGYWNGVLTWEGRRLRHGLKVGRTASGEIEARIDMPDQGEFSVPVTSLTLTNRTLRVEVKPWSVVYSGDLNEASDRWKAQYVSGPRTAEAVFERAAQPLERVVFGPEPSPADADGFAGDWKGLADWQSMSMGLRLQIVRSAEGVYRMVRSFPEDPTSLPMPSMDTKIESGQLSAEWVDGGFNVTKLALRLSKDRRRMFGTMEAAGRMDPVVLDRHSPSPVTEEVRTLSKPAVSSTRPRPSRGDSVFSSDKVSHLEIEVSAADLAKMETTQSFKGMGERASFEVTVREGEKVYSRVAMHLKGAIGSFRPIDQNPSITLDFDRHVPRQRFHGLDKISLNNSVQDPTYASERLARELFREAGIPSPRAGWASVRLNGRELGLYVLVEGYNRRFLEQHFDDARGNLYDGGLAQEIDGTGKQPVNSGRNPKDQKRLAELLEASRDANLESRFERMSRVLDVDRFATFTALEVAINHWDGYSGNRNNYRIYHEPVMDRLVFLPHGLDQTFQSPDAIILPRMPGVVSRGFLETVEGRRLYLEKLRLLASTVLNANTLTNRVRAYAVTARSVLERQDPKLASAHEEAVAAFCGRIVQRIASVQRQIEGAANPVRFGDDGTFALKEWTPTSEFGSPGFGEATPGVAMGSGPILVRADKGPVIAHWTSRTWLERGRYRFEGRIRTRDLTQIAGDRRGGASLRSSHRPVGERVSGSQDWSPMRFEFEVLDPLNEIQLRCEVRANGGLAEFDRESLRVRRLGP